MQACTKSFLELEPKTGLVEDNFYKTESDAFLALVGVYDALTVQNWQFIPLMSDIFSDDAFTGGADAKDMSQWHEIELSQMTDANNSAADLWNRCYSAIYRANLYMEKEGGITWTNPENRKRFLAEAKFIRGYIYFDLARHYGWVPIITSVLPSIDDYRKATQNTPAEVYTQAAKDILAALPDLPATIPASEIGRITKYAAKALISRIYLYHTGIKAAIPELGLTGAWTDGTTTIDKAYVQAALDDIITTGGYSLVPNYADLFDWYHQNSSESILEFQYSEKAKSSDWGGWGINGNFSVIFYGMRNPAGYGGVWDAGWSFATITWSLINEYEAGDPRKDATVFNADAEAGSYLKAFENSGFFNKKFMPRNAFQATAGSREHALLAASAVAGGIVPLPACLDPLDRLGERQEGLDLVRPPEGSSVGDDAEAIVGHQCVEDGRVGEAEARGTMRCPPRNEADAEAPGEQRQCGRRERDGRMRPVTVAPIRTAAGDSVAMEARGPRTPAPRACTPGIGCRGARVGEHDGSRRPPQRAPDGRRGHRPSPAANADSPSARTANASPQSRSGRAGPGRGKRCWAMRSQLRAWTPMVLSALTA
jgi:hypothetical protein